MKTPDKNQQAVIDDLNNNIILYAGAGTGKTFTVANKIAYYVNNDICKASDILCLTFTVKACKEIEDDVKRCLKDNNDVLVKTIHGFCFKIVNEYSLSLNEKYVTPSICDEIDSEDILKNKILPKLCQKNFEDMIKAQGARNDLEWLKNQHVYYNEKDNTFYFIVETSNGYFLINYYGNKLYFQDKSFLKNFSGAVCPNCCNVIKEQADTCPTCGYDFRNYIPPYQTRVTVFRPFVSLIKRERAILGIYSGNEEADYQAVFDHIFKNNREKIERVLCFKEVGYKTKILDVELLEKLKRYCGFFVKSYNDYLASENLFDYDDMIIKAYELLSGDNADKLIKSYRLIVIDEMQDTSLLEYEVISKFFYGQVMLCGDINQSIYKWRGAKPNQILALFKSDFSVVEYYLTTNYRSTKQICNYAQKYVEKAFEKENNTNVTPIDSAINGEEPKIIAFKTALEEAKFVYEKCQISGSYAVLSRNNFYAEEFYKLINQINDKKIDFFCVETEQKPIKSVSGKLFLNYLKLLFEPNNNFLFEKVFKSLVVGGNLLLEGVKLPELGIVGCHFLNDSVYKNKDCYSDLVNAFDSNQLVVFDFETGGLDVDLCEIVQISAQKDDGTTFNRFIKNKRPLDPKAVEVHGFSEEFLAKNGEELKVVLSDFVKFCDGCVLVGHNSTNFDYPILKRVCLENGLHLNCKGHFDTLILAKTFYNNLKNYKLETLCNKFGVVNERAHDAMFDVISTKKILEYIIKDIKSSFVIRKIILQKNKDKFFDFYNFYSKINATNNFKDKLLLVKEYILKVFLQDLERIKAEKNIDKIISDLLSYNDDNLERVYREYEKSNEVGFNKDRIPIITVHQAKGMEFDTVFLIGADEVNFPEDTYAENEQRRVFYVAITRAKKTLYITYVDNAYNKKRNVSPLINYCK